MIDLRTHSSPRIRRAGLALAFSLVAEVFAADPSHASGDDWPAYLGNPARTLYSRLDQINKGNVADLRVAWTFDTGDVGEYQSNNLVVDGVVYTASPARNVIALNAATGETLWRFNPGSEQQGPPGRRQRGVLYWADGDDRRIFTAAGTRLYALQAATGRPIRTFGENGSLHLGTGLRAKGVPNAGLNTPGVLYKDLLIISANTGEDVPGAVRAFDARTGELRWIFHTIPQPGEYGYETWPPDAWKKVGGASAWAGIALDEHRGIVFAATETAGPDFWGGERFGENLFANCIIALDANTGRRLWHYQLVHHDIWDMDLPTPPVLLTVTHEGRRIDAVAQGTKQGLLFVFDRVTGEPLWPIHEMPAPPSEIPEVRTWPTQPVPARPPPLMRQVYTADEVSTLSAAAHALTSERLSRAGSFGAFPPPRWMESIKFPGFDGGFEWGGSATDPDGILYVNINEIPWIYQLVPTRQGDVATSPAERQYLIHCSPCHGFDRAGIAAAGMPSLLGLADRKSREEVARIVAEGGGRMPPFGQLPKARRDEIISLLFEREVSVPDGSKASGPQRSPAAAGEAGGPPFVFGGFRRWFDAEGYPAIKPPWGTLNAVDLNTGEIKWKVTLGEYAELTARGIPPTGTENYGGPVVTAGGLVFIGATADETFRAFDKDTGEILWQAKLPFGGNATPSTYRVNGRQYVLVSAGGGKSGRPAGGSLVAFALPEPASDTPASAREAR
jgi:quinoprotein glucose dehydrogenase